MSVFYAEKFKLLRKSKNVTMTSLAKLLNISRRTLWAWENGERIPDANKIYLLAKFLKVKVNEISDLNEENFIGESSFPKVEKTWKSLADEDEDKEDETFQDFLYKINKYHNELKKATVVIKALLSSMNAMFYIKTKDHKYVTANRSFLENCSYHQNILVNGKTDSFFFSKQEAIENQNQDQEVFNTGKAITKFESYIPGSRKKKWGLISKLPILDKKGNVIALVGTFIDITARRDAEESRAVLEESLAKLSESVLIADFNAEKYLYANKATEDIYEYPVDKFYKGGGKFWINKCVHPEDKNIADNIPKTSADTINKEFRVITESGKVKWISALIAPETTYLNRKCNIIIERDVTEKKNTEIRLKRLEEAINKVYDCIWIGKPLDETFLNFEYEYISDSIVKFFDVSPNDVYRNPKTLKEQKEKFFKKQTVSTLNNSKNVTIQYVLRALPEEYPSSYEENIYEYKDGYYTGVIRDISNSIIHKQVKELYELNINAIKETISICDLNQMKYLFLNKAHETVSGYSVNEFYKKGITFWIKSCVHPDFIEKEIKYLNNKKWPEQREFKIVAQNGEVKWMQSRVYYKHYCDVPCIISISLDITQQKIDEERRIALENAIEASSDCFWVGRKKQNNRIDFLYINRAVEKILGISKEDFIKNSEKNNFPETNQLPLFSKNLAKRLPVQIEYKKYDKNLNVNTWYRENIAEISDLVFGVIRNVSEQKENHKKIALFKKLASKSNYAVYVRNKDNFLILTPKVRTLFEDSFELFKNNYREFINTKVHKDYIAIETAYYDSGKYPEKREYKIIKDINSSLIIEETVFSLSYEGVKYQCGLLCDITNNYKVSYIYKILEKIPETVGIYSVEEKRYIYLNSSFEEMFGRNRDNILDKNYNLFLDTQINQEYKEMMQCYYEKKKDSQTKIYKINHPQKGERWIETTTSLEDYSGKPLIFSLSRDITGFKAVENVKKALKEHLI